MEKLVERRKYYQRYLLQYKNYMKDLYAKEFSRVDAAQSFSSYTSQEEQQFDVAKYVSSHGASTAMAIYDQKDSKTAGDSATIRSPTLLGKAAFYAPAASREDLTSSYLLRKSAGAYELERSRNDTSQDLTLSANEEHLHGESFCTRKSPGYYKKLLLESRNLLEAHSGAALAAQPAKSLVQSIRNEIRQVDSTAKPERFAVRSQREQQRIGSYYEEINRTIRQLSKLERDNELYQKKIEYGALNYMIERQNSLLESQIQRAEQFKATYLRLDYQLQSSKRDGDRSRIDQETEAQTYDFAVYTDLKFDKETYCRAKRQRKPQLESRLFMARLASFDDSYMCLSQTSQEYLKWRRGQE